MAGVHALCVWIGGERGVRGSGGRAGEGAGRGDGIGERAREERRDGARESKRAESMGVFVWLYYLGCLVWQKSADTHTHIHTHTHSHTH